jgi:hypothetical protein
MWYVRSVENPLRFQKNYGDAGKVRTLKFMFAAGAVHEGVTAC